MIKMGFFYFPKKYTQNQNLKKKFDIWLKEFEIEIEASGWKRCFDNHISFINSIVTFCNIFLDL